MTHHHQSRRTLWYGIASFHVWHAVYEAVHHDYDDMSVMIAPSFQLSSIHISFKRFRSSPYGSISCYPWSSPPLLATCHSQLHMYYLRTSDVHRSHHTYIIDACMDAAELFLLTFHRYYVSRPPRLHPWCTLREMLQPNPNMLPTHSVPHIG